MNHVKIRLATIQDIKEILCIYNEGIEDRIATLETSQKDLQYMTEWFVNRQDRYKVIVAELDGDITGWASLNQYNSRKAYDGVADLSVYIKQSQRGKGIGGKLLSIIEIHARNNDFHKIVIATFPFNELGQGLYKKKGYREVGVFQKQGKLDGKFVDVMVMEKLLS